MKKEKRNGVLFLFVALSIFWLIISSQLNWIDLLIGFFASALIVWYSYDMVFSKAESTKLTVNTLWAIIKLSITLLKEIIVANFHVAKIVLSPKLPVNPGFKKIHQPLKKPLNQALYGNAITLTPGTLTVEMTEDYIIIHGLEMEHAREVEGSKIEAAFKRLEAPEND